MNVFRKQRKIGSFNNEWKATGSFVRKPVRGWIHPDHQLQRNGVTYEMKVSNAYITLSGCSLTLFFPMFPFDPPENIRKPLVF